MARTPRGVTKVATGWQVRLVVGHRNGKPVRRKATLTTLDDATAFVRRVEDERAASAFGVPSRPAAPRRWTLQDASADYVAEIITLGRRADHVRDIARHGRYLCEKFGPGRVLPLYREDATAMKAWLDEHHPNNGTLTNAVFQTLRTLHNRCDLRAPKCPVVKVEYEGRRRLPLDDVRKFVAALPIGSLERAVCLACLLEGARESEVHRLRVRDLNREALTLDLRRKTVRGGSVAFQTIPLLKSVASALLAAAGDVADLPPDAPLLSASRGATRRPLGDTSMNRQLIAASERAGMAEEISTAGWLRNQCSTFLGELGCPPRIIDNLLGHATGVTRRHYDWSEQAEETLAWLRKLETVVLRRGHLGATRGVAKGS